MWRRNPQSGAATRNSSRLPAQRIHSSITRISSNFQLSPLDCRVVFRVGHPAGTFLLIPLKFRQPQFFTDLVVANAQLLNLLVRHVYLLTRLKVHAVDDTVRVNVFTVNVRADQHLAALEISGQPAVLLRALCAGRCLHLSGSSAPCGRTSRRRLCGAAASYSETRRTPFPAGSRCR